VKIIKVPTLNLQFFRVLPKKYIDKAII